MTYVICRSDDPQWLDERRKRVTASDISVWMGSAPEFWNRNREGLIAEKLQGLERQFDAKAKRRTIH